MKRPTWIVIIAIAVLGFTSCGQQSILGDPSEPTNPNSIFGLWQEQDYDGGEYMRFLTAEEESKDGEYFFGREWDEGDGVYEKDLKRKGNGWFKWKINGTTLTMIELMDNGGAEYPKTRTITTLNATQLKLQDPIDREVDIWNRKK